MSFNLQPTCSNELLIIRPLTIYDFDELFMAASDPHIWEQHATTDRWKLEGFQQFFKESLQSKGALVIIDRNKDEIIGSSRYKKSPNSDRAIEIGWSFIAHAYWGGKYNQSFKTLMIEHALESMDYVLFLIAFENTRSQRATMKLGGEKINSGPLQYLKGKCDSHHTYVISNDQWVNTDK